MINGDKYEKKVEPPMERDILLMSKEEANNLNSMQMFQGSYKREIGSMFYSYMASVNSFEQIQKLYTRVKKEHLNATHIMCGYPHFSCGGPSSSRLLR